MKKFIPHLLTPLAGILGLLALIPIIFLPPLFMGKAFSEVWFDRFFLIFAILGVFALLFYIFTAIPYHLQSRLSLRWQRALKGIAAGFGLTYFIATPIQTLVLIPYVKWLAAGNSAGLEGLIIVIPLYFAIFIGPFAAALFGYIGYRSGRRRETEKLLQREQKLPSSENIKGIVLDTLGIFGIGLLGFILFSYLIAGPLRTIAGKDNVQLALHFRNVISWLSIPAFAFLGFYASRLFQRRQGIYQTIFAIFLILSFIVGPSLLTLYLHKSSLESQQFIKSDMSITNFEESVVLQDNPFENELTITAQMNVPVENDYWIHVHLNLNAKPLYIGSILVNTENHTESVGSSSGKKFTLREGEQPIEFVLEFSKFFEARIHPSYRTNLFQAIMNNAVVMDITIQLYGSGISGKQVYGEKYIISRESFERLGLISLLQEAQNQ